MVQLYEFLLAVHQFLLVLPSERYQWLEAGVHWNIKSSGRKHATLLNAKDWSRWDAVIFPASVFIVSIWHEVGSASI